MAPLTRVLKWMAFVCRRRSSITGSAPLRAGGVARKRFRRGVPSDLIETVRWFSDTLDRTETSRTIVGVGLFNLGLGVHDKETARNDRRHAMDDRHRVEPAMVCPSLGSPPRMPSRCRRA